ncbi:hypothetical protein COEREDRAFT_88569 [Coemansia reversa NRRL 1564]|uniref:Uncharacterized protein n=1 Tax=Coemansia reversa (strain ATCC 12441 / NRRL 1564) TaxID=763665 RepID=A0A2G5B6E8_COERN|nr:hypothetical protein COEREDRAFT_88569 [Coemansia reversa NRRL 1564]|eukprot:PIA14596.1 hypothetical protein COEREDRAFT_88569 [Coemansia reversa NRRL 1564]
MIASTVNFLKEDKEPLVVEIEKGTTLEGLKLKLKTSTEFKNCLFLIKMLNDNNGDSIREFPDSTVVTSLGIDAMRLDVHSLVNHRFYYDMDEMYRYGYMYTIDTRIECLKRAIAYLDNKRQEAYGGLFKNLLDVAYEIDSRLGTLGNTDFDVRNTFA